MRINLAVPEAHVDAPVLNAALEAVTRLNESMLASGETGTAEQLVKKGARWKPEPVGDEHFDHGATIAARGWGDCDDWAPLHAASLRHTGEDPHATAIVQRSGPHTWHAVVERADGSIDDPSKRAGMGQPWGIAGAVMPLMMMPPRGVHGTYILRPSLALRPHDGEWQARADLPWHWTKHLNDEPTPTDIALATLHQAPVAHAALTGAILGAVEIAEVSGVGHPDHIERLCCLAAAVEGWPYEELAAEYGREHAEAATSVVGSFWKHLSHMITHPLSLAAPLTTLTTAPLMELAKHTGIPVDQLMHSPLAHMAASLVPGGGMALDAANMYAQHMPSFSSPGPMPGMPGMPATAAAMNLPQSMPFGPGFNPFAFGFG